MIEGTNKRSSKSMCINKSQQEYRSDGTNKVQLNVIEGGTNHRIQDSITVKKLIPRYLPLISTNLSNYHTVLYDENALRRPMFPMEVLQRIKHIVLLKFINETNIPLQDVSLEIEVITTSGRIEVDEQMLFISASSEEIIEETGITIANYMTEINKSIFARHIMISPNTENLTVNFSSYLKNIITQNTDLGCNVTDCLSLDNLEMIALKSASKGLKNVAEDLKGGLLLHEIEADSMFAQVIECEIALNDGVLIHSINGILVRSQYELYIVWNCIKHDAYCAISKGIEYSLEITFATSEKVKESIKDPKLIVLNPSFVNDEPFDIDEVKDRFKNVYINIIDISLGSFEHAENKQFSNFEKKISPLVKFIQTGSREKVLEQMWDTHCRIVGDICDEKCQCLLYLPRLCEGICRPDDPFGFFLIFCPRFHKKLRRDFPGDIVSSVVDKLVVLWNVHKSRNQLGSKCIESCSCDEYWSEFRRNVNVHVLTKDRQTLKVCSASKVGAEIPIDENVSMEEVQPMSEMEKDIASCLQERKQREIIKINVKNDEIDRISDITVNAVDAGNQAPGLPMLPVVSDDDKKSGKRKLNATDDHLNDKAKQLCKEPKNEATFKVTFSASKPLGFYCYTKKDRHRSYCLLFSVKPDQVDTRLKRGLIIDRTSSENEDINASKPVSAHETLKRRYDVARSKSENIVIWFSCEECVDDEDIDSQYPENPSFWSLSGDWKGPPVLGWAGGAETVAVENIQASSKDLSQVSGTSKVLKSQVPAISIHKSQLKYSKKEDPSPSLKSMALKIAEVSASSMGCSKLLDAKSSIDVDTFLSENQQSGPKKVSFDESCKESDVNSEAKTYMRRNKNESTHSWTQKVTEFYCQKCENRRQKSKSCEQCHCCYSCGSKNPCPNESKRSSDQSRLLGKRYQQALKTAFGLSSIATSEYNVENKDDMKIESSERILPDASIAMELINQEPSLVNKPLLEPIIGYKDNLLYPFTGKSLIFAVAMYAKYEVMLKLLMIGADATQKGNDNKTILEYVREYCDRLEKDLKYSGLNGTVDLKAKRADFSLKRDLLSIFARGIDLQGVYSAVNSWYTVQVSIEGGTNIRLTESGKAHPTLSNLYCVTSWENQQDTCITTAVPFTATPVWTNSEGYFFNVNNINEETYNGKFMKFELFKGSPDGEKIKLSEISVKGLDVIQHARPGGTTGEFTLPRKEMLSSGNLIITVRKKLHGRDKFESEVKMQKNHLATETPQLINDIVNHFNRVKTLDRSLGDAGSDDIFQNCTPTILNKMKCLHFAVYLENPSLVKSLISYNVNVDEKSHNETPLELARARSSGYYSSNLKEIIAELSCPKESIKRSKGHNSPVIRTASNNNPDVIAAKLSPVVSRRVLVDVPARNHIKTPPIIDNPNWILPHSAKPCFAYKCAKGVDCKFTHIHIPERGLLSAPHYDNLVTRGIESIFGDRFNLYLQERREKGDDGQFWYTAGYQAPSSLTIYYAAGGVSGVCSAQNIWWYLSPEHAIAAVKFIVLTSPECTKVKSFIDSVISNDLPVLENPEWMLKFPKIKACYNFQQVTGKNTKCMKGNLCAFAHFFTPRCSIPDDSYEPGELGKAYYSCHKMQLTPSHFQHISRKGKNSEVWWHTAAFTCPVTFTIYNACKGGKGKYSAQKLWWYPSKKDALCAVEAVVLVDLKYRNRSSNNSKNVGMANTLFDDRRSGNIRVKSPPSGNFSPQDTYSPSTSREALFSTQHTTAQKSSLKLFSANPSLKRPLNYLGYQNDSNNVSQERQVKSQRVPSPPLGKFSPTSFRSMLSASETPRIPPRSSNQRPIHERIIKCPSPPICKFSPIPPIPIPSSSKNETSNDSRACIVSQNTNEKKLSSRMFGNSHLPILEDPNWMVVAPKSGVCHAFNRGGSCRKGIKCKYAHLYIPPSESKSLDTTYEAGAVEKFYKKKYGIELHRNDFQHLGKTGKGNQKWWAAAFRCPKTATIYYARGGQNAECSTQDMWWYPSVEDARRAAEGVALSDFKNRNIYTPSMKQESESSDSDSDQSVQMHGKYSMNTFHMLAMSSARKPKKSVSKEVPILERKDWILDGITKASCPSYNRNGTCSAGQKCRYAHIYKFKGKLPELPPDPKALFLTYEKFGFNFGTCNRFYKCEKGRNGKLWYTAAIVCPIDSMIYYAAGGVDARRSKQKLCNDAHLYWYPSEESAKAACDSIVLYALRDRDAIKKVKK